MYTPHTAKKLLDRIKPSDTQSNGISDTLLGNWYVTALFWKPQVALLVNEKTLLPVLMPLATAIDLASRFPVHLADVLAAHGVSQQFIDHELSQMSGVQYAKTANRSVVGIMNQVLIQRKATASTLKRKICWHCQSGCLKRRAARCTKAPFHPTVL